ncbi:NDP-hexose 2,3-dehydratase family protein [Streptomonospora litoralis]|uniref:NDP-hexose 2,3-dehydratase n=1 Tax=Streptomonospora litoralis TaxID=2498135 RepID=A0A4P6Q7F6_9ACTN|nr:NDP-hexose 2,3-dehydratase family protein [Streptomonospora litoralis]QBI54884.1 NDP-hexose 2,3-dehydratase [Streptomonospora litoralis]
MTALDDGRAGAADRVARSAGLGAEGVVSLPEFRAWFAAAATRARARVARVPLGGLDGWAADAATGDIRHESGRFFSVRGLDVRNPGGATEHWSQPIIDQPEIGVLGILVKEFDGVWHLLMQAKTEPGNVNGLQLSPTVQATRSNYTGVHRGRAVPYIEYFLDPPPERVVADSLQSEQGSWFLRKHNRNMVVEAPDEPVPVLEDFCWLTLGQVHALLAEDDVVNMDARTVLSCLPFHGGDPDAGARHSTTGVLSRITAARARTDIAAAPVPLASVQRWHRSGAGELHHESGRFFRVVGVDVATQGREVRRWSQPMIEPCGRGLTALLVKDIGGTPHALLHARTEPGFREGVELGPTLQCTPANYPDRAAHRPRFLDAVAGAAAGRVRFDTVQSEEGGRFYHARTRNVVLEVDDASAPDDDPDYVWLSLPQIDALLRHSHYLNIQARSLVACLRSRPAG